MANDDRRSSAGRRPLLLPPPTYWTQGPKPDWLLLPREVLATIFLMLGAVEIIKSAQKVCTFWRSVSNHPSLWKHIHIRNVGHLNDTGYDSDDTGYDSDDMLGDLDLVCRDAVDRSRGSCVDISIEYFGDDHLIHYIVKSGCQLRRLRLFGCTNVSNKGVIMAAPNLPLLETFEIYYSYFSKKALVAIGHNCPNKVCTLWTRIDMRNHGDLDVDAPPR